MASKTQFDFFKAVYDEEIRVHSELESKAKLYLTIITFYLGAISFKINDLVGVTQRLQIPITLLVAIAVILILAFLFTIGAMGIRKYERICDLETVIRSFGEAPAKDNDFLDEGLVNLAVATNRNASQNNRVGTLLQCASVLIFTAISLQLGVLLFMVFKSRT